MGAASRYPEDEWWRIEPVSSSLTHHSVRLKLAGTKSGLWRSDTGIQRSPDTLHPITSNIHLLLAYVADLELEVDRLRKQAQFVH